MTLDVKICGLSTPDSVRAAVTAGATHTGYIFFEKSPRHLEPQQAAPLAALSRCLGAQPVAVTVNATDARLDEIVSVMKPAILQLHGSETPERVAAVKARYQLPVMKALAVSDRDDLAKLEAYRGIADRFLLDAKPPKGSDLPGGNAVRFDWSILAQLHPDTDYLLAGGIDAHNVAQALAAHPPGLDISSGVEVAPGIKDERLIAAFFGAINEATAKNA